MIGFRLPHAHTKLYLYDDAHLAKFSARRSKRILRISPQTHQMTRMIEREGEILSLAQRALNLAEHALLHR